MKYVSFSGRARGIIKKKKREREYLPLHSLTRLSVAVTKNWTTDFRVQEAAYHDRKKGQAIG